MFHVKRARHRAPHCFTWNTHRWLPSEDTLPRRCLLVGLLEERPLARTPTGQIVQLARGATESYEDARLGLPSLDELESATGESCGRPAFRYLAASGLAGQQTPTGFQERCGQFRRGRRRSERSRRHPIGGTTEWIDRRFCGIASDDLDTVTPAQSTNGSAQQVGPPLPALDQGPSALGKGLGQDERGKADSAAEIDDRAPELWRTLERAEAQGMSTMDREITADLSGA